MVEGQAAAGIFTMGPAGSEGRHRPQHGTGRQRYFWGPRGGDRTEGQEREPKVRKRTETHAVKTQRWRWATREARGRGASRCPLEMDPWGPGETRLGGGWRPMGALPSHHLALGGADSPQAEGWGAEWAGVLGSWGHLLCSLQSEHGAMGCWACCGAAATTPIYTLAQPRGGAGVLGPPQKSPRGGGWIAQRWSRVREGGPGFKDLGIPTVGGRNGGLTPRGGDGSGAGFGGRPWKRRGQVDAKVKNRKAGLRWAMLPVTKAAGAWGQLRPLGAALGHWARGNPSRQ